MKHERRRMGAAWRGVLCAAAGLALAGCSALSRPDAPSLHDLGLAAPVALAPGAAPARVDVLAPAWLDSAAMQYRLDWNAPTQRRNYAASRWVAPPPALLEHQLARALGGEGARNHCRLRIELDEFVQIFADPQRSQVELVARASLLPARTNVALGTREFRLSEPAPSADAPGGVSAYRLATVRLGAAVGQWLGELDAPARCTPR